MIITFCGHSSFQKNSEYERMILRFLKEKIGDGHADFYLGGYGLFDDFAYECCREYKKINPCVGLYLITPYITIEYQKNHLELQRERYDGIIYPEIEAKPLRFAISYRNKWMVEKADYIVSYVNHSWGGAYKMYAYAKRIGKRVFNIGKFED